MPGTGRIVRLSSPDVAEPVVTGLSSRSPWSTARMAGSTLLDRPSAPTPGKAPSSGSTSLRRSPSPCRKQQPARPVSKRLLLQESCALSRSQSRQCHPPQAMPPGMAANKGQPAQRSGAGADALGPGSVACVADRGHESGTWRLTGSASCSSAPVLSTCQPGMNHAGMERHGPRSGALRRAPRGAVGGMITSDGADGPAVDDELGAVDRGGAVGGEIGDEVGNLFGLGSARRSRSRPGIEYGLTRVLDRAAIGSPKRFEKVSGRLRHDPAGRDGVDPHALRARVPSRSTCCRSSARPWRRHSRSWIRAAAGRTGSR